MKKAAKIKLVALRMDELNDIIPRAVRQAIAPEESEKLRTLVEAYAHLTELVNSKNVSIGRLRQMLFGSSTEKTSNVLRGTVQAPLGPRRRHRARAVLGQVGPPGWVTP